VSSTSGNQLVSPGSPDSATDHASSALPVQESGVPARTLWRLSLKMQYDRVFPVAMPGELHIPPICPAHRMDAEIPATDQNGGDARSACVQAGTLAVTDW